MSRVIGALMPGAGPGAVQITIRNLLVLRQRYGPLATGLAEPFLYLLSIGIGVGALVGDVTFDGETWDYRTFVAPAMLAAASMNAAVSESTFNIFAKLRWERIYWAFINTPLSPADIAFGELLFAQLRGLFYSTVFLVTMVAMGLVPSWWGVLALPAVTLVGFSFAAIGMAAVTWFRRWEDSDGVMLAQVILFLFSATFFPVSVYPPVLQVVVQLSPLYHGVALCRDLVLGRVGWVDLWHAGFLVVVTVVALRLAAHRFTVLLHGRPDR